MCDQELNNNNNVTNYNTYNVHSQSVQIGDGNKLHNSNEQPDRMGNVEYDMEQMKLTIAAQDQKLENQAEQLKTQAEQLNMVTGQLKTQAEELKVHERKFNKLHKKTGNGANQQITNRRIKKNCSVILDVCNGPIQYKGEIQVAKYITVRELKVKLQKFGGRGAIVIYGKKGGEVYNGVTGDDSRTVTSLGLEDGDVVYCL